MLMVQKSSGLHEFFGRWFFLPTKHPDWIWPNISSISIMNIAEHVCICIHQDTHIYTKCSISWILLFRDLNTKKLVIESDAKTWSFCWLPLTFSFCEMCPKPASPRAAGCFPNPEVQQIFPHLCSVRMWRCAHRILFISSNALELIQRMISELRGRKQKARDRKSVV